MSKIYLQSRDTYADVAQMDLASGAATMLSKNQDQAARDAAKTGFFASIDDKMVSLFRHDDQLYLQHDTELYPIESSVSASWELSKGADGKRTAVFVLQKGGSVLLKMEYPPFQQREPIAGDDTAGVDEEDYDFMIFVTAVLSDDKRRANTFAKPFNY